AAAWSSPEPYFFDPEAFVLVLQDMPGTGLFELLKKTAEKPQTIQAKDIDWIATAMIDFLFKIKDLNVPDISLFQNSPLIPVMNRMYSRNLAIAESYGIENGEEWQSRAAANDGINATSSFSFGDFWPNSVLVDLENKRIGIIDWELGRTGHYGQDLTQMLANLCLMKYAKSFDGEAVGSLEKKVCDAWREKRGELDDEGFDFQAGLVKRVLQLSRVHAADVDDMGIILRQEIENSSALLS
ncbi:kinase-like domain-containing protein, partial [Obelidium mucronatum]